MAVTGPFYLIRTNAGDSEYKEWYRGGWVTGEPLSYIHRRYLGTVTQNGVTQSTNLSDYNIHRYSTGGNYPQSLEDKLYARAYDKLVALASGKARAQLGQTLYETRKSFKMISKRLTQLHDFGEALQKRNFAGVVRALGFAKSEQLQLGKRSHWRFKYESQTRLLKTVWDKQARKPGTFANNYLEYVFGWAPLVQDIGQALLVLSRPFPAVPIRGFASDIGSFVETAPLIWNVQPEKKAVFQSEFNLLLQTKLRITNPNLMLANELGLVNLVHTAWSVIPYSFLIDQTFVPIGKYLRSYSDFVGMLLDHPFKTRMYTSEVRRTMNYGGMAGRGLEVFQEWGLHVRRDKLAMLNVPTLKSRASLPVGNLLARAASTAALLVQQHSKHH